MLRNTVMGLDNRDPLQSIDPTTNFFDVLCDSDEQHRSQYYDISEYNDAYGSEASSGSNFIVMNYNIRSFAANSTGFAAFLDTLKNRPKVLILTETWMTTDLTNYSNIDGYNACHTVRKHRRSGGVSIYCSEDISMSHVKHLCQSNETIESCVVKLTFGKQQYVIVAVYRPHSNDIDSFSQSLDFVLNDPEIAGMPTIVAGDMNVNLLSDVSASIGTYITNMHSLGFLPVITKPTRFPNGSLLDHVWINYLGSYSSGIITFDLTDHCPTFCCFPVSQKGNDKVRICFRSHKAPHIDMFINSISQTNWDFLHKFTSVDEKTDAFISKLDSVYCRSFPLQVRTVGRKRLEKPWLTPALLESVRKKARYFKLYKEGLISESFNKNYKNKLTSLLRASKESYFRSAFEASRSDIRNTWKLLKSLTASISEKCG